MFRPCKFFLCFSLCARVDFRHSPKKKKTQTALSDLLRGIPPQRFSCPHRYRRLHSMIYHDIYNPGTYIGRYTTFPWAKRCRATFSAHQDLQRGAVLRKKKERREKRLIGVDRMTGLLLTVLIEEDSGALPRRRTAPFSFNKLYKKALCVVEYDGRQIAHGHSHGLCESPCACQIEYAFLTDLLSPVSFNSSLQHWKTGKEVYKGFTWPPSSPLTAPSSAFTERFS